MLPLLNRFILFFLIAIQSLSSLEFKNSEIVNEIVNRLDNLNWYEKKAIQTMDFFTFKKLLLYQN